MSAIGVGGVNPGRSGASSASSQASVSDTFFKGLGVARRIISSGPRVPLQPGTQLSLAQQAGHDTVTTA